MRQPTSEAWYGFMAFAADTPICGTMREHPAWSPQWQPNAANAAPVPTTAQEWAENYNASKDRFQLEREAADTVASIMENRDSEDEDDIEEEEADVVMPVAIDTDGTLFVYAEVGDDAPMSVYTKADVYAAFGMEAP